MLKIMVKWRFKVGLLQVVYTIHSTSVMCLTVPFERIGPKLPGALVTWTRFSINYCLYSFNWDLIWSKMLKIMVKWRVKVGLFQVVQTMHSTPLQTPNVPFERKRPKLPGALTPQTLLSIHYYLKSVNQDQIRSTILKITVKWRFKVGLLQVSLYNTFYFCIVPYCPL